MMIKCPDGRLINMDLVMDVTAEFGYDNCDRSWWVKFSQVNGDTYLPCQSEDEARETVDLIFRCRASRLDLAGL